MSDKRLVKAVWMDAHCASTNAYALHEIPHDSLDIITIGWLLKQDDIGVSIANEYCADATYRGYTFIPAGMLKSIEDLVKPKKPRKPKQLKPLETPNPTKG